MGTVIGMFADHTGGSTSNLAAVDVPMNGTLVGVDWDVQGDLDIDGEQGQAELSFGSTISITTNDTRSRISTCGLGQLAAVAAGSTLAVGSKFVLLPDINVGMGERIFLHANSTAGATMRIICNLHFSFDLDKALARRR